jgi:phosphatidylserine decarboxylase
MNASYAPAPYSPEDFLQWLKDDTYSKQPFRLYIDELKELIENDPRLYLGFTTMFHRSVLVGILIKSSLFFAQLWLHSLDQELHRNARVVHHQLTRTPPFRGEGVPFYAMPRESMNTTAGWSPLLSGKLNSQLKKIFDAWLIFLSSPESRHVLVPDEHGGWFSPSALVQLSRPYSPIFQ